MQRLPFLAPYDVKEILLHGNRGSGKGLSNDSMVLTAQGWKQTGEITKSDRLVAPDGQYTDILNIWKRGIGPLFKVTFNDGASVVVDDVHKWSVSKDTRNWQILNTAQLIDQPGQWFIPLAKAPVGVEYKTSAYVHRGLVSIVQVDDGPSTCFEVDHSSHQFICQDEIVTHNSDCMLVSFLRGVNKGYGANWRGFCFKRTIPETEPLFEKAKLLFQSNCPAVKFTTHPYKVFRWPWGEMLTIRHLCDPEDYQAIHGSEVGWLAYDELTNWNTPEVYLKSMSLLRSSHPEVAKMMQVWCTTNPTGPGHQWVMRRWKLFDKKNDKTIIYDDEDTEELARWTNDKFVNMVSRPRMSIFLDARHNDIFMKANPTYLAEIAKQAPNDDVRRAWLDGDWSVVSGGRYDHVWNRRHHVVKPFPIPRGWKIDRSHDAGSSTPFAVLWYAESDGSDYIDGSGNWRSSVRGDIFAIFEWYGTNGQPNGGLKLQPQEISKGIIERELIDWQIYNRVVPGPADNAIHAETIAGMNVAGLMLQPVRLDDGREFPGVEWTRSDKHGGARITGWNLLEQYLANAVPDPEGKLPREKPGLFIFERCKHLIEHLPVTPRDPKKLEDVPIRGEYHLQDTLRYRILDSGRGMSQGPVVGLH